MEQSVGAAGLMWALPGVWAMVFGLGLFACRYELPQSASWVAGFYVMAGMVCLLINSQLHQLSAWQMVVLFGFGQSFLGLSLFFNGERRNG